MKLRVYREGDRIPEGAKYVRSEQREVPGSEYERVVAPRSILSWLGITEMVATMVKCETVYLYEVPEE